MRILITGAASFLGRHLVEYFLSKDEEVLALIRENARGKDELLKYEINNKFKLIVLDMKDIEKLDTDFDICIHLAWGGIGKVGRMDKAVQSENIDFAKRLMKVCKEKNAKRMLFAGSQAEYGQTLEDIQKVYGKDFDIKQIPLQDENSSGSPKSEYGKAKLLLKTELKKLGDNLISSCINNFRENIDVHTGECLQSWNYIYIKDLCNAIYLLSTKNLKGNYVFNIAGEDNKRLMDYVKDMKRILKSNSNIIVEKREAASEGTPFLNPSISVLREIGFKEAYGFEGGIKDMCDIKD